MNYNIIQNWNKEKNKLQEIAEECSSLNFLRKYTHMIEATNMVNSKEYKVNRGMSKNYKNKSMSKNSKNEPLYFTNICKKQLYHQKYVCTFTYVTLKVK